MGDTNNNPNGAGTENTASLLAGAMMRYSRLSGRVILIRPTLYVQYMSQVTYTDEMRYNEAASDWNGYYVQTLSNLESVIAIANNELLHDPIFLSNGSPENQTGVAKIFQAVIFKRITDTWGDAPYNEALQGFENVSPSYDTQETIYKSIIEMVKEARDMMDTGTLGPKGDIIYDGDVTKWKKFANSLILQLSLQLSKKYPGASGYAATEFKSALNNANGVIDEVEEEAWFKYDQVFQNPWNANRRPDYFMAAEFIDALKGEDSDYNSTSNSSYDARIEYFANDASLNGVPYGFENGSGAGATGMSTLIWNTDTSLPLLTSAYTYLNRAEAANLGWTTETASTLLSEGIMKSYESLEVHWEGPEIADEASDYAAARVLDATTFGLSRVIAEEKWVALFPSGFDAWAEWRRTEIPALTPATDFLNNGTIPRRYVYPTSEATLNSNNYASGVGTLSPSTDNNSSKVWWDQ